MNENQRKFKIDNKLVDWDYTFNELDGLEVTLIDKDTQAKTVIWLDFRTGEATMTEYVP